MTNYAHICHGQPHSHEHTTGIIFSHLFWCLDLFADSIKIMLWHIYTSRQCQDSAFFAYYAPFLIGITQSRGFFINKTID